jgi:quinol monooxygenase YgiN
VDAEGAIRRLGSYEALPGPEWGWTIVLGQATPDALSISMCNVAPGGEPELAGLAHLARRPQISPRIERRRNTMGQFVIACYTPKPGQLDALLRLVVRHVPALREQGLVTDRAPCVMRAADGTILEVFEWASAEAIDQAHHNPAVQTLWAEFGDCCTYTALAGLAECQGPFAGFEPV